MVKGTILVADDDLAVRVVLDKALSGLSYRVKVTESGRTLRQWVEAGDGNLVITDVIMPDENGLDLIPMIKRLRPDLAVIVMSAQNTLLTAVKAMESGAFDYLSKPFDLEALIRVVECAIASQDHLPVTMMPAFNSRDDHDEEALMIGRSYAMQELYLSMARLMSSDLTVMITGESGTGKELVAQALHVYGKRRNGPFVAINMAAIPRDLIESELFGHEKGAFTGAHSRTIGRFEQAKGGTLFLDEIGDMPQEAQTRLLRVLQEGEYTPVGGLASVRTDVRIIAATHRNLLSLIRQGKFREDLFYRLNVVPIRLPSLQERSEDIPALVRHFLKQSCNGNGATTRCFTQAALSRLCSYKWPGNVRELKNLVARIAALYPHEVIGVDIVETELANVKIGPAVLEGSKGLSDAVERHLNDYFSAHCSALPASGLYERVLREVERPMIMLTLNATKGNQIKAAEILGVNRNTLRKRIRELGIQVSRGVKQEEEL